MKEELKQKLLGLIEEIENAAWQDGYREALKSIGHNSEEKPIQIPVFNLTNNVVQAFMSDLTYEAKGFACGKGKSVVLDYCGGKVNTDYAKNVIEHPLCVQTSQGTYWNLIPNREYVFDGVRFKTEGTVRQIYFPDTKEYVDNCRDIGGYKCEGGRVKYGCIIRSAKLPENLTKTSIVAKVLRDDCGVTCEIDLRGQSAHTTLGWSGLKAEILGYASVITNTKNIKNVFTRISAELKNNGCVLVHCNAGADRTGTVVAIILGLLGVSEADIIKDWELTTFSHCFNSKIISQWGDRIADPNYKEIALKEFPKGELREFFIAMKSTFGKNGETFQQQCVAFLKKAGVTDAIIKDIKTSMIEKS